MRKLIFTAILAFSAFLLYSCEPTDIQLQGKVKSELLVSHPQVNSNVRGGIVTLSGIVDSEDGKTEAENMTKAIDGVKSVVNEITVVLPPPPDGDELLKRTIERLYKDERIDNVTVTVKDSMITLTGTIKKADQKRIVEIAKSAGPKKVYETYLNAK